MFDRLVPTRLALLAAFTWSVCCGAATAQIRIGVDLATTGPAASIGIPSKNVIQMWPKEIAGQKIEYIVLDDGSTPTGAVLNARKLTSEDKIDVLVGPTPRRLRSRCSTCWPSRRRRWSRWLRRRRSCCRWMPSATGHSRCRRTIP